MKKLLSTMLIAVLAIFMLGTVSKATTEAELKEYMTTEKTIAGTTYVIRDADKVKLEKFFANNEITDEQATKIGSLIEKSIALMNEDKATDPSKLSTKAKKQQLLAYAQEAASTLGLTVSYDATEKRLDVYKNGTLVDSLNWGVEVVVDKTTNKPKTVVTTEPKAVKTGSTNYVYAIAAGVVVIAGITLVVARKKNSIA